KQSKRRKIGPSTNQRLITRGEEHRYCQHKNGHFYFAGKRTFLLCVDRFVLWSVLLTSVYLLMSAAVA
ncbi:MAG: hypothetical protein Q9M25_07215, partial [Mariprofundaceae bacterium]|nr:hypothetical protein [Mariprofundaceae bacterium]